MFYIENAKTGDFAAMRAASDSEVEACACYATLYNAQLSTRVVDDVYTNVHCGAVYTTLLTTEWRNFEALAEHMLEVHDITLTAYVR